ncbi:MAG: response regulator transcription factor [Hyphomicrobium sp.]|nr:response regulator transcription factor [Hyphomicrobium sp.]
MLILIAEDDANLRRGLAELLQLEGFETVTAKCGLSAVATFESAAPDFCILDVSMPGIDGFEACKRIRGRNGTVPILFLTAHNEEIDRVLGLGMGADDYMGKPFGTRELIARIKAISRRAMVPVQPSADDGVFVMSDLRIDPRALRAYRGNKVIALSAREVAVLTMLHKHAKFVVTRNQLYDECWGQHHFSNSRALDQFISALRRKVEIDPSLPRIISTVHGSGYRYDP